MRLHLNGWHRLWITSSVLFWLVAGGILSWSFMTSKPDRLGNDDSITSERNVTEDFRNPECEQLNNSSLDSILKQPTVRGSSFPPIAWRCLSVFFKRIEHTETFGDTVPYTLEVYRANETDLEKIHSARRQQERLMTVVALILFPIVCGLLLWALFRAGCGIISWIVRGFRSGHTS